MARKSSRSASRVGHIEHLEGRTLMAADVTASLSSGTLTINGTDRADAVEISQHVPSGQTIVRSWGKSIASFPTSSIRAITVSLGNGNDSLSTGLAFTDLNSMTVNMGRGVGERCFLQIGSVGNLNVDADASIGTAVTLSRTTVTGSANVQFGNGSGQDGLQVQSSQLKRLWANMGNDNDNCNISSSSIDSIQVAMGGGDDSVFIAPGTGIGAGSIDGGSGGNDRVVRSRTTIGARVSGFERVS